MKTDLPDAPAETKPEAKPAAHELLDRPDAWRVPLSWVYGGGRWLHRSIYDAGLIKRERLPRPVVCVGNLTVGGTGKTPFLIALVDELRRKGRKPAVLSRGYRARPVAIEPRIVSDGTGLLCGVEEAGDEPFLIARRCPRTPVVICARRVDAGRAAIENFDPDLLVLDDGFQHEALERDVNIVLWDARDLPREMRRLPAGRLREGLGALKRAQAIVITHLEYLREGQRARRNEDLRFELERHAKNASFFEARSELAGWRPLQFGGEGSEPGAATNATGETTQLRAWDRYSGRALLVSGLARPEGFEAMAREAGVEVAGHLKLPDHAAYSRETLAEIEREARRVGADRVLTTEKDAVKLDSLRAAGTAFDVPIDVAILEMRIAESERWSQFLDALPRP